MIVIGAAVGVGILLALMFKLTLTAETRALDKPRRADHRRIHQLEWELGFRDDPPEVLPASAAGMQVGPGAIIPYNGPPPEYISGQALKALQAQYVAQAKWKQKDQQALIRHLNASAARYRRMPRRPQL